MRNLPNPCLWYWGMIMMQETLYFCWQSFSWGKEKQTRHVRILLKWAIPCTCFLCLCQISQEGTQAAAAGQHQHSRSLRKRTVTPARCSCSRGTSEIAFLLLYGTATKHPMELHCMGKFQYSTGHVGKGTWEGGEKSLHAPLTSLSGIYKGKSCPRTQSRQQRMGQKQPFCFSPALLI